MRTASMKHRICLISRFACQVHAKPAERFFVHGGKDDRGMYFTAFELRKLAERQFAASSVAALMDRAISISSVWSLGLRLPR